MASSRSGQLPNARARKLLNALGLGHSCVCCPATARAGPESRQFLSLELRSLALTQCPQPNGVSDTSAPRPRARSCVFKWTPPTSLILLDPRPRPPSRIIMSSPVAIPQRAHRDSSETSSGSPTGLYVPIHKRSGSAASASPQSPRDVTPPRTKRTKRSEHRSRSRSTPPRDDASSPVAHHTPTPIPTGHKLPRVYDVNDLLTLSFSPLVGVTPAQRDSLEAILQFTASQPAPATEKATRRRRPGRRTTSSKKLTVVATADVKTRRQRHGNWGWQVHAPAEESWRHASVAAVSA
ncbi:hypothetical protein WOLCODRAFT_139684 [Wolfiporia cocos MD-104 SS10]|uniref:Uncharacterized protein n=1 Tax=Wolfiporia cocos (strain MD-104) TaxID=742152 RepID=A0A2H3J8D2_WOLCO|nr:hypothetical protein WOLCODRAFT_139684 [Wolfiporia cocos MD-104 SS10]